MLDWMKSWLLIYLQEPAFRIYCDVFYVILLTEDRMKVLDVIEECQSKPRDIRKENAPALGNL